MREFNVYVGIKTTKEQQALICFGILRTSGITMTEFISKARDLQVFTGVLSKTHNTVAVGCETFSDLSSQEAKDQMIRMVLLQLGAQDISVGSFETYVRNNYQQNS